MCACAVPDFSRRPLTFFHRKSSKRLLALLACAWVCAPADAAEPAAPRPSYLRALGRYVFVMQAPDGEPQRNPQGVAYPHSGLYPSTGSTAPLWTVDWYSLEVYVSADGQHLARVEGRAPVRGGRPEAGALALAFYERGQPLKAYALRDVIQASGALPVREGAARWAASATLVEARGVLRVKTVAGERFEFSMTTGEQLSRGPDPDEAAGP